MTISSQTGFNSSQLVNPIYCVTLFDCRGDRDSRQLRIFASRERERERGREREREKEGGRERIVIFIFKGVAGALAPFSYLVLKS